MNRYAKDGPLSKEDLQELKARLGKMRDRELTGWYDAALKMCRVNEEGMGLRASYVQQLVQAWRELRRRGMVRM